MGSVSCTRICPLTGRFVSWFWTSGDKTRSCEFDGLGLRFPRSNIPIAIYKVSRTIKKYRNWSAPRTDVCLAGPRSSSPRLVRNLGRVWALKTGGVRDGGMDINAEENSRRCSVPGGVHAPLCTVREFPTGLTICQKVWYIHNLNLSNSLQ